jgi:hypothetical protein
MADTAAGQHPALAPELMTVALLKEIPAPYNPRYIEAHELNALRESLKRYGAVEPLVVNRRTQEQGWPADAKPAIVGGHQRVKAAELEGVTELPIVWVDLTETAEVKLNLALNRIAGKWDEPKLGQLLLQLVEQGEAEDLLVTGFQDTELEELLEAAVDADVPDDIPEFGDPTVVPGHEGFVHFHFGEVKGYVATGVYDDFKKAYAHARGADPGAMLDDVLKGWIGSEGCDG